MRPPDRGTFMSFKSGSADGDGEMEPQDSRGISDFHIALRRVQVEHESELAAITQEVEWYREKAGRRGSNGVGYEEPETIADAFVNLSRALADIMVTSIGGLGEEDRETLQKVGDALINLAASDGPTGAAGQVVDAKCEAHANHTHHSAHEVHMDPFCSFRHNHASHKPAPNDQDADVPTFHPSPTTTFGPELSNAEAPLEDWQVRLMDCFEQIDCDRSGAITRQELRDVFRAAGLPPKQALELLNLADVDGNGVIDRMEWHRVITDPGTYSPMVQEFVDSLAKLVAKNGRIYSQVRDVTKEYLMLSHDGVVRSTWDFILVLLLIYLIGMVPMNLAFGDAVSNGFDDIIDYLFLFDVCLNFRTNYVNSAGQIVQSGRKVACHYFRTWFFLDFISSVPFDKISGSLLPSLQPARLLKAGKVTKVFKMVKLAKLKNLMSGEQFEEIQETIFIHAWAFKLLSMLIGTTVLAHLLACFLIVARAAPFVGYLEGEDIVGISATYLAAWYWAITTMSTVGYGDIIPISDMERVYSMIAMAVGVTFFGYVMGNITAVITARNLNARAYEERMQMIQSWLDFHGEIPKSLRQRIRRHFRDQLTCKAALDDSVIMNDLSMELRQDLGFFLMHEEVRFNPLFADLPNGALEQLCLVLDKSSAKAGEHVVNVDQPGLAMFIIVEGVAYYEEGHQWLTSSCGKSDITRRLGVGDSFGEEIILNLEERYLYSIKAETNLEMFAVHEKRFLECFKSMPDIVKDMRHSFLNSHEPPQRPIQFQSGTTRCSVVSTPNIGMPATFPDAVLDALQALLDGNLEGVDLQRAKKKPRLDDTIGGRPRHKEPCQIVPETGLSLSPTLPAESHVQ